MTISLYDASVASYLQTVQAVSGFLDKGLTYCRDHGIDPEEMVEARIFPDMFPLRFQIQSVAFHSLGAVEAIQSGLMIPPAERPAHDYAGLQALITDTGAKLQAITPEEINGRAGADVTFRARGTDRLFTAEGFLLSFSLPNFYFHATTAYDILRSKGVPLGKMDFISKLRLKA
ncbi:DUF1993 domain-containing protein [Govanella unica]|uniref:DUF1993 domain-containing protein n=1 Tax=Govanella unica TaxID=2975056 RepID=A0A9X3TYK8_9PROT|nr:DUF1993 domain-containing protein [Govania unica]MDA5194361.1 DUF1993 domain-containing protein [Govania unica]